MTGTSLPHQIARTRRFTLGAPSAFTVSPDGGTVYFLRTRAGDDPVSCLWALDVATGRERLLADPLTLLAGEEERLTAEERIRRERARQLSSGIVGYAADRACELLAFALSGRLWTVRTRDGEVRELPAAGPVADPRPDPTGRNVAYVSGGELRVVAADGSADRAIAVPEGPEVTYGLADHIAAESIGRRRGHWWAPDGRSLLVARVDTTPVQRWYVSDPADPTRPPVAIRYPSVGTANADVSLWITDLDGDGVAVRWDSQAFEYLTAAGWDAFGPYAAVQSRDQRHVQVLGVDAATGAVEVLAEQRDAAWVTLVGGLPARTASGTLLTCADLGDTRTLLREGHPVTPDGLQLHEVLAVDGETVLFTASDEPTETHLWAHDPDHGLRRISEESGVHGGATRGGATVLVSHTTKGDRVTVRREEDEVEIASRAERPVLEPRMELLSLGPQALRAALFLPSWHREEDGPLPVLMDPYGGPAMRKVTASLSWLVYVSQWFAEQGFAVLAVDGRGTPGRGPAWERAIHLDLAGPVLEDQVEGLHEAARLRPCLDLTRVGIRGWSFGGFLAAMAVLRRPDVFHAAVAGAPVTDQRLYDTHFRERHLGHPDEHPEAYDRSSPIREAASLSRPLLLVHGLADDNVVAAHTLRMSAALLAAGRPHEVLPLSGVSHQALSENVLLHQLEFLRRALGLEVLP
ncbi:prolyl oligopeptidase family serine peptidase [Nonomuraea sp. NPDC003804]|uniref:S9 family peptidase n=1 Tax=Nonomuraea sp. NPDC003804 TaxID=3154547 RepID=UPI0033B3DEE7